MFKVIDVISFNIGECIGDSKRTTLMIERPEYVIYNIISSSETKSIVEAWGHNYEETKIKR